MNDIFTKFYSTYIDNIHDFLSSKTDILYINGYSGSGKSSVLKQALKIYNSELLVFPHICFKGTSINDFLLSFYDAFKRYAVKGKISLVKNPEEGFMQKVSFYFKSLEYPFVVVIDNFELISENSEIADFLLHISSFENVKVILISKSPNCEIAENPTVSVDRLTFEKIDFLKFVEAFQKNFKDISDDDIKKFYNLTQGYELYIKMALTYIETTGTSLTELLKEFNLREKDFFEFLIEKQISLIPNNYYPILQNFAFFNHNIPIKLLTAYSLGDEKELPYLISKHVVSEFFETYYIKTYLRNYFSENISLQDKIDVYSKIISIYEKEIEKTLKDRILRLSRETMRKLLSDLKDSMPKVQKVNSNPAFNYMAQAITGNPKWFVTDTSKKMNGLNELRKKREERLKLRAQEAKNISEETKTSFDDIFSKAVSFEKEHKYNEALEVLLDLKSSVKNFGEKTKVYLKISKNYEKLNDKNSALAYLRDLASGALECSNYDVYSECRILMGKLYKKMYAFSRAKAAFSEVISKADYISKAILARAKNSLAEIYELESNFNAAIKEYKEGIQLLSEENKNNSALCEASFKLASIYDETEEYEEALIEYKNSIRYAKLSENNNVLIRAYTNSGIISSYAGDTDEAINFLKKALEIAKNESSVLDLYYISRSIASVYMNTEPEMAYDYLLNALEYARSSDNSFETAISLLELGDYYYNQRQNEQALICYFQAKNILGASASKENTERINSRINDMKIKLGDYIFNGMKALYEEA